MKPFCADVLSETISSPEQPSAAKVLITTALEEIKRKFGENGETPLPYQNETHSLGVTEAIRQLATEMEVSCEDTELLLIAAAYHDLVHGAVHDGDADERASAELAAERMRASGHYTGAQIERVQTAILATVPSFEGGVMTQPNVTDDPLTQIMADADLAHLGNLGRVDEETFREYFWEDRCLGLWRQMHPGEELTPEKEREFMAFEIKFLENHQYHTEAARALYGPAKEYNTQRMREILASDELAPAA